MKEGFYNSTKSKELWTRRGKSILDLRTFTMDNGHKIVFVHLDIFNIPQTGFLEEGC
jgi:hypothetical protein